MKLIGDKSVNVTIQGRLKELVDQKGLRKAARELSIDHASLYRSLNSDIRLSTIQAVLNLFGYDLKIVK
jgi:DNA-binding phage protein